MQKANQEKMLGAIHQVGKAVASRMGFQLAAEPTTPSYYGARGLGLKKLRANYSANQTLLKVCGNCKCKRYNVCRCTKK